MTIFRIQELESLGFEWDRFGTTWEDRFSELTDSWKLRGHCNVPQRYSENSKLANWVGKQRGQYKLHLEGKRSLMTLSRHWRAWVLSGSLSSTRGKGQQRNQAQTMTRIYSREGRGGTRAYATAQPQEDRSGREISSNQVDVAFKAEESGSNVEVHLDFIPGRT
jgi:hypothetical protein